MLYLVLRPLGVADGKVLKPGEIVDASGWKNLDSLIFNKKLRPVGDAPVAHVAVESLSQIGGPVGEVTAGVISEKRKRGRPKKTEDKVNA